MNCETLAFWLDEGRPALGSEEAQVHLESCTTCSRSVKLDDRSDQMLRRVSANPSLDFVAQLMMRVHSTPQLSPTPLSTPVMDFLPWWVRAAAQPATVMAFVLAGVLFWQAENLITVTQTAALWAEGPWAGASGYLSSLFLSFDRPMVLAGVLLGISPLLAMLALASFWGSQSVVTLLGKSLSPRIPQRVH